LIVSLHPPKVRSCQPFPAPQPKSGTFVANGGRAQAARIGDEHPSGRYQVRILLTRRRVSRAEAAASEAGQAVITRKVFKLFVSP
jgi:hypothetical protein